MNSPLGAKLKFIKNGFLPTVAGAADKWEKVENYEYKSREKCYYINLEEHEMLGVTVSDCKPGYYITSLSLHGQAATVGIEIGDRVLAIDDQLTDNTDADHVGALLKKRKLFISIERSNCEQIEKLIYFLSNKD